MPPGVAQVESLRRVVQGGAVGLVGRRADLVERRDAVPVGAIGQRVQPADRAGRDQHRGGRRLAVHACGRVQARGADAGWALQPAAREGRRTKDDGDDGDPGQHTHRQPRGPRSRSPRPAATGGLVLDAGGRASPQVARRFRGDVPQRPQRESVGLVRVRDRAALVASSEVLVQPRCLRRVQLGVDPLRGPEAGALVGRGPMIGPPRDPPEAAHRGRPEDRALVASAAASTAASASASAARSAARA